MRVLVRSDKPRFYIARFQHRSIYRGTHVEEAMRRCKELLLQHKLETAVITQDGKGLMQMQWNPVVEAVTFKRIDMD